MEHDNDDDEQSTRQQLVGIGRDNDGYDERNGYRREGRKIVGSFLREFRPYPFHDESDSDRKDDHPENA